MIIPVRVKDDFFCSGLRQIERMDDQSILMHFHNEIIRREMTSPLLWQCDLTARRAFDDFTSHKSREVRK